MDLAEPAMAPLVAPAASASRHARRGSKLQARSARQPAVAIRACRPTRAIPHARGWPHRRHPGPPVVRQFGLPRRYLLLHRMPGIGQQLANAGFVSLGWVPLNRDSALTAAHIEDAWLGFEWRGNRLELLDRR